MRSDWNKRRSYIAVCADLPPHLSGRSMSMTHGQHGRGSQEDGPPRPPSSAHSGSASSGSGSKHLKCIGRYVLTGTTLGKGNFARVEAAVHTLTRSKVSPTRASDPPGMRGIVFTLH